jgi:hypothetical protein
MRVPYRVPIPHSHSSSISSSLLVILLLVVLVVGVVVNPSSFVSFRMSKPRRQGILLLLLSCVGLSRITADDEVCGLWFAPSTIPGAGWGVFAGKAYEAGSRVIAGDLTVPLQELAWHNGFDYWDDEPHNLWYDYYWNHDVGSIEWRTAKIRDPGRGSFLLILTDM